LFSDPLALFHMICKPMDIAGGRALLVRGRPISVVFFV
jgi:hypothetical protein